MKGLRFFGASLQVLAELPERARQRAAFELRQVRSGLPSSFAQTPPHPFSVAHPLIRLSHSFGEKGMFLNGKTAAVFAATGAIGSAVACRLRVFGAGR